MQEEIYFPQPDPLYLILGVLAGNMLKGHSPIWLMLVGAPSAGKGVLIDMITRIPKVHMSSDISGKAAFMSAVSEKDKGKEATGGILRVLGKRGLIAMKDFTSVLSKDKETMKELIGALREIFDGRWSRDVGTDGGTWLEWGYSADENGIEKGRLGFLGACTDAIDDQHNVIQELGQRWIYYRFCESDGWGESKAVLGRSAGSDDELSEEIAAFMRLVELDWDSKAGRELSAGEQNRLISMGQLIAQTRSSVKRNARSGEIERIRKPEIPSRLVGELGQLLLGLEAIGLNRIEYWRIVCKVAWDSAPTVRTKIIEYLRGQKDDPGTGVGLVDKDGEPVFIELSIAELRDRLELGSRVVVENVDDLVALGVLDMARVHAGAVREDLRNKVRLKRRTIELLRVGWRWAGVRIPEARMTAND